jgi:membrane protease subunit HflK
VTVLSEYEKAKTVTRERLYLESMDRILPGVEKFILSTQLGQGNVLPLLPLKSLAAVPPAHASVIATPASAQEGK